MGLLRFNSLGVTLIELLAVIAILGILLAVATPNVMNVMSSAEDESFEVNVNESINAIDRYILLEDIDPENEQVFDD